MSGYTTSKREVLNPLSSFLRTRTGAEVANGPAYGKPNSWRQLVELRQETYSFRSKSQRFEDQAAEFADVYDAPHNALRSSYDTGHEFYTRKQEEFLTHPEYVFRDPVGPSYFKGPLSVIRPGYPQSWPTVNNLTSQEQIYYGTTAIENTKPGQPLANVAETVAESIGTRIAPSPFFFGLDAKDVRDSLREYSKSNYLNNKAGRVSNVGDDYLNVQFGWLPLLNEVMRIVKSTVNAHQNMRQLYRDSGRLVRRSFQFNPEVSTTETLWGSARVFGADETRLFKDGNISAPAKYIDHVSRRIWFRGAFTYFVPKPDEGQMNRLEEFEQKANHLLGTRVTPEVLYNAAPWSWLADYASNLGSALSLSSTLDPDRLVLHYGYLMRHTIATRTYTMTLQPKNLVQPITVGHNFQVTLKERVRATPYGFAIDPNGFTAHQWSILAALGLTKSERRLF